MHILMTKVLQSIQAFRMSYKFLKSYTFQNWISDLFLFIFNFNLIYFFLFHFILCYSSLFNVIPFYFIYSIVLTFILFHNFIDLLIYLYYLFIYWLVSHTRWKKMSTETSAHKHCVVIKSINTNVLHRCLKQAVKCV